MDSTVLQTHQREFANYLIRGFPSLGLPGLPAPSAAALTGNATQENACRAVTAGAKDHGSDGVMQWRLDRLADMKSWCQAKFGRWDTLEAQAAFCLYECKRDYRTLWAELAQGALPLADLTTHFCEVFERPNAALANLGYVPGKGKGPPGRINYAYDTAALIGHDAKPAPVSHAQAATAGAVVAGAGAVAASAAGGASHWAIAAVVAVVVVVAAAAFLIGKRFA